MDGEKPVIFKGRKDGLDVWLDDKPDFDAIREAFREKTESSGNFFNVADMKVSFTGRRLLDEQRDELMEILAKSIEIPPAPDIGGGEEPCRDEAVESCARQGLDERAAVFHNGTLRSGQSVRYAGDVIVLGDVNPGAEVIAEGNIIILGSLKGTVHAGCAGDDRCFVSAVALVPIQLRICDKLTHALAGRRRAARAVPSYAFLQDGQIYVAPLVN
ncbi:MAG: septum site-determining protein MinC [Firmicutes bacterium]|nr:septum site-determining protein MinC [Bacillota bacterium]